MARRALEALVLEEYKIGSLTKTEMRRMLGYATRYELDIFLKEHSIDESFTFKVIQKQVDGLGRLGF